MLDLISRSAVIPDLMSRKRMTRKAVNRINRKGLKMAEQTKTGNEVQIGEKVSIPEFTDSLSFTVPKDNLKEEYLDKAGEKIETPFTYGQVENDEQARAVCEAKGKGWSLVDFVNDALKALARSNTYQRLTAQYKQSEMSPEEARQRLINAFQRQGVDPEFAAKMVDETLKNK